MALMCTAVANADTTPVLNYHFDNDAGVGESYVVGGTVHDYSGNGNDGQLIDPPGAPTWIENGVAGGAFDFTGDGVSNGQGIYVPHADSLNPGSGDFSLALWILTRDNYDGDVLRKGSTANSSTWYKIELSPSVANNKLSLNFKTDGTNATINSTQVYDDSQWHFVVAQRNGDLAELWIDGMLDKTAAISGSISNIGDLGIGCKDTMNDDFLNGSLDELSIYMRALTGEEIQQMYSSIPEPATLGLLGFGALSFLRRRRS